jgi:hypothetical protein
VANVARHVRALGNPAPVVAISARTGSGLEVWLDWLRAQNGLQPRVAVGAVG